MNYKQNCWEYNNCGRQPGGHNTEELGICPVPLATGAHGINGGINAGRSCWAIKGSRCDGKINGTISEKLGKCMQCDFYAKVRHEEGPNFQSLKEILKLLKKEPVVSPAVNQNTSVASARPRDEGRH